MMMMPANQCLKRLTSYVATGEVYGIHVNYSNTDSIQKCLEALGAPTPAAQWEPITAAELCTAASGQKGTAAGLDGFSGTEVSYLPLKFWTDVVHLFQEFERSGLIPEAWNNIKQVHLPKPNKGKRIRDGATDVATSETYLHNVCSV